MMEHVVRLTGGLGNQLFQYALGRAIALSTGAVVRYDLGFFEQVAGAHVPRTFALAPFKLRCEHASTRQIALAKQQGSAFRLMLHGIHPRLAPEHTVLDHPDMRFDPGVLRLAHPAYIDGYWQSERYFIDIADRLREDLVLREAPSGENARMAGLISGSTNAVSVHVRRGDYVSHPISSSHHLICGADYYASAMQRMLEAFPDASFFVFSDDLAWCRAHLRTEAPISFMEHNGNDAAHEDMRLMSLCRHHIIANSSLSWWGAWLNASPAKQVIAPLRWFRDPSLDPPDLVPAAWIRM